MIRSNFPRRRRVAASFPPAASTAVLAAITLALAAVVAAPAAADTTAAPGPPANVTARAGDQLAEVSWDAPAPEDPSITGYTVGVSPPDTAPVPVEQTVRTATVSGLTNGDDRNLNGEYALVRNTGRAAINLADWVGAWPPRIAGRGVLAGQAVSLGVVRVSIVASTRSWTGVCCDQMMVAAMDGRPGHVV